MGNQQSTITPQELRVLWDRYDVDQSNALSIQELQDLLHAINEHMGSTEAITREFVVGMFEGLDEDGDGIVEWDEFENRFFDLWEARKDLKKANVKSAETKPKSAVVPAMGKATYSTEGMKCPCCSETISDSDIRAYIAEANSIALREGRAAPFDVRPGTGFYAPKSYPTMQTEGRVVGQVPPSFFTSPYNTHTWYKGHHF